MTSDQSLYQFLLNQILEYHLIHIKFYKYRYNRILLIYY